MDIQEKLDTIEQRRQQFLNQTNDEKNTQIIKDSYDEYVSAKQINEYAPEQLEKAETNYYKAKYGIDYIDKQKEKYKSESIQMTKDKLKAHQEQLTRLNESLDNYKNSLQYSKGINEVKSMHLAKIKSLIEKIRLSDAHTNQQKTFYTEQEEDVINSYIITFNWFIGLFTIYYIFDNRRNPRRFIIPSIFLLSILFILKPLIHLFKSLFHFQFQFGYDPMKSKIPWILYAFFILVAIWIWVYLDIFTLLYQRPFVQPTGIPTTATRALVARQAAQAGLARQAAQAPLAVPPLAAIPVRSAAARRAAAAARALAPAPPNPISSFFTRAYQKIRQLI